MLTRRHLALSALALPFAAGAAQARVDAAPITAALRLTANRVMMDVMFNGQGPFPFVVDTGAVVSGLRQELAERLQLKRVIDVRVNGKGMPLYTVDDLVLGGAVRQEKVQMFGLPVGRNLAGDGLLAAGMMTTYDSELDFERQQWRIYPKGQDARTGYARLASTFEDQGGSRRILADVDLGGKILRPMWDTGAPGGLSLDNVTGRALGLWNDKVPYAPMRATFIQGPMMVRVVRAPDLTIGSATFATPLIDVRPLTDHPGQPILGLSYIRTLNLAIDASARAIWVRPNNVIASNPRPYPPSGLWLDADDGTVKVGMVGTGSPAAQAGVRAGDVLDGVTSLDAGLDLIREAGRPTTLKLRRKGQPIEAAFTPRLYL